MDRLLETFCDLKDTVELFQQLMRTEVERRLDLNDVVRKTVSLLRPSILTEGIRLETELSPDLPALIGSPIRLQQVFLNIMLNAVQQMVLQAREGMILSITTLCEHANPDRPLKVHISDTGPGIHRQLWGKIFDLGFTTRPKGTGQGLYIARSLVESLGGKIRVERSIIQIGTTFLVELPTTLPVGGGDDSTTLTRPAGG